MKIRNSLLAIIVCVSFAVWGCSTSQPNTSNTSATPTPARNDVPSALPANGFKAALTIVDAPVKLRAGQKQTVQVKVKNASDVMWYARGAEVNNAPTNAFYLAAGNRWLKAENDELVSDMDGRHGLDRDLKPGEETTLPLVITAPKQPGDYTLELDLVQEQVAWFKDKGSPTARVKIKVER